MEHRGEKHPRPLKLCYRVTPLPIFIQKRLALFVFQYLLVTEFPVLNGRACRSFFDLCTQFLRLFVRAPAGIAITAFLHGQSNAVDASIRLTGHRVDWRPWHFSRFPRSDPGRGAVFQGLNALLCHALVKGFFLIRHQSAS